MPNTVAVIGYAWPLEVKAGETVQFKLSSTVLRQAHADIVKVRCGDPDPTGPGIRLVPMPCAVDGDVGLCHQVAHMGSCGIVPDAPVLSGLQSFSVGCWIWPTLLNGIEQTLISRWNDATGTGWRLYLDSTGRVSISIAPDIANTGVSVSTEVTLMEREWCLVGASFDAQTGEVRVFQESADRQAGRDCSSAARAVMPGCPSHIVWPPDTPLCFAAQSTGISGEGPATNAHYNGKLDRPRLYARPLDAAALRALCAEVSVSRVDTDVIGEWDFSQRMSEPTLIDIGGQGLHGALRNTPMRAVTGANWTAQTHQWTEAPHEYGAIHFHDDDIDDCGWRTDLTLTIPADWPSGFYALRLQGKPDQPSVFGQAESYVSFFVGAAVGQPKARLAFVAPTATFLAYANSGIRLDLNSTEAMLEQLLVLGPDDAYLQEHREIGMSVYDTHSDGSGWCYSSGARPLLNMRPYGGGYYAMETRILDWLDALGEPYDVITDQAIHRHGSQMLASYACVITGSHPEYYSREMLDAFERYQGQGGRHMYLGGNGFYWRTAFSSWRASHIEIRRGTTGTRTWECEPGENGLSFTGEPSGLWRSNGRAPQRLVGVGFDAQVFDRGGSYRRLPDSRDPRAAFIFDGIGVDETIGDFGLRGGAAGHEIDRVDTRLGSPPHLLHVATADDIGSGGLSTPEEFGVSHRGLGGDQNNQIRADMTFFPTARGGAVFTTGSIAWCMALWHQEYRNNVSRITENVLRRFLDPAPFEGFDAPRTEDQ